MVPGALRDQDCLVQIRWVNDDKLRPCGRGCRQDESQSKQGSTKHGASCLQNEPGATYAGNSRSLVRYTFTRCPSRIVIVGRRFRNLFMTCKVACDVASDPPAMTRWVVAVAVPSPALPRTATSRFDQPDCSAAPNVARECWLTWSFKPASPIWFSPRN